MPDRSLVVSQYGGDVTRIMLDGSRHELGQSFVRPGVGILADDTDAVLVIDNGANLVRRVTFDDNISYMQNCIPLTDSEREVIHKATGIIERSIAISCTGCRYCVDDCPQMIPIPEYFALYNSIKRNVPMPFHSEQYYYYNMAKIHGKASDCIACGKCEMHCPQHLPVIATMKLVKDTLEIEPPA